jgi:hypothetical protein
MVWSCQLRIERLCPASVSGIEPSKNRKTHFSEPEVYWAAEVRHAQEHMKGQLRQERLEIGAASI